MCADAQGRVACQLLMLPHSCVNSGHRQLFPSRSGGRGWEAWHPQLFITSPQTGTCECPLTHCSTAVADLVLGMMKWLCSVFRGTIASLIFLGGCEGHLHLFDILRLPASKHCLSPSASSSLFPGECGQIASPSGPCSVIP